MLSPSHGHTIILSTSSESVVQSNTNDEPLHQHVDTSISRSPTLSTLTYTTHLLHVIDHTQLQVILPLSLSLSHTTNVPILSITNNRLGSMQTWLQT